MKTCLTCKYFNLVGVDMHQYNLMRQQSDEAVIESVCMFFIQNSIRPPEWVARAGKTTSEDGTVCDAWCGR